MEQDVEPAILISSPASLYGVDIPSVCSVMQGLLKEVSFADFIRTNPSQMFLPINTGLFFKFNFSHAAMFLALARLRSRVDTPSAAAW